MAILLIVCLGLMVGTIFMARNMVKRGSKPGKAVLMQVVAFIFVYACAFGSTMLMTSAEQANSDKSVVSSSVTKTATEAASEGASSTVALQKETNKYWDSIAMALSVGLACIGCGIAIASAAPAAIGAVSEDPKAFGKAIIFVGLAESVSLFGLLVAILIKFI